MSVESIARKSGDWGKAVASAAKCLLRSGRPFRAGKVRDERLVIMANGPSLRNVLDTEIGKLKNSVTLSVNFAANAPEYSVIRPDYYVLADPHFFRASESDPNVARLWKNLRNTTWPMVMFLPLGFRKEIVRFFELSGPLPENVTVKWFNLTPGEGAKPFVHWLYRHGWATPRPRNVLIASLMVALREGFRDIVIVGADHTWLRSLWVDDDNRVVSVQPHFYKDGDKEKERVSKEYEGYRLHDILGSMTVAFRSYHQIADYAGTLGARISNATPGSFIDAFPRVEGF